MTGLADSVREEERSLMCERCGVYVEPVFSESGPHIRADCPQCGQYIKFVKQKRIYCGVEWTMGEPPCTNLLDEGEEVCGDCRKRGEDDEALRDAWRSDAQAFYVAAYKGRSPEHNFNRSESAERIWRWMGGAGCLFANLDAKCPDSSIRLCLECRR